MNTVLNHGGAEAMETPTHMVVTFVLHTLRPECHDQSWYIGQDFPTSGRNTYLGFISPMHRIGDLSERITFSTDGAAEMRLPTRFCV